MDRLEKHQPFQSYARSGAEGESEYIYAYNGDAGQTVTLNSPAKTIVTLHYSVNDDDAVKGDSRVVLDNGMMVDWSEGYVSVDLLNGTRLWTEPKSYFLEHASSIRGK